MADCVNNRKVFLLSVLTYNYSNLDKQANNKQGQTTNKGTGNVFDKAPGL